MDVDLNPAFVAEGIDMAVYKVSMSINPSPGSEYKLHFANSLTQKTVRTWGFAVEAKQARLNRPRRPLSRLPAPVFRAFDAVGAALR